MQNISEGVLQVIAGDIEGLLLEQREGIDFSYRKISDGIKLSISISLDPTAQGVSTEYSLSYPLEQKPDPAQKQTVKKKRVISEEQEELL